MEKGQAFCDTSLNHCPFRFYVFRRRQRAEHVLYHADCNRRPTLHHRRLCLLHLRILALLPHSAEKIARSRINDPYIAFALHSRISTVPAMEKGQTFRDTSLNHCPFRFLWLLQTAAYRTCSVPCRLQPPPHPPPQEALPPALPCCCWIFFQWIDHTSPEPFRVRTRFFSCISSLSCASFSICFRT